MIRKMLAISALIAAAAIAALPGRAEIVVGEDFFYQQPSVIPTSFGNVRFALQNYGGGVSGPAGAWDERWVGLGAGTILSDDATTDTSMQPFISNPFTSRFNGENSVNNDIRRNYSFADTVDPQQTLYFGGRFLAAEPADEAQIMYVELGILSPSADGGTSLVNIGLQQDTFFGRIGRVKPIVMGDTEFVPWGAETVLGDPGEANDNTADQQYHTIVGKLEFNVGGVNTLADYNNDGVNNAADYTVWRDNQPIADGSATFEQGDGNGDGNVNQVDYDMWNHNFNSQLDRLTVYIDPTGVEQSNGSTLVAEGQVSDSLLDPGIQAQMFVSGGFQGSRETFVDDAVIGTAWEDVVGLDVPRLDLEVNTATGDVTLVNNTDVDIDLAFYEILSDSGSLDVAGWNSLDDQDADGGEWAENNPSAELLTESNFSDSTTLIAAGGTLSLGAAFNTAGMQDLLARWGTKQGAQGLLNLANVTSVSGALGGGAAVPEPSSLMLITTVGLCVTALRRKSQARTDRVAAADARA